MTEVLNYDNPTSTTTTNAISEEALTYISGCLQDQLTLLKRFELGRYMNRLFGHGPGYTVIEEATISRALIRRNGDFRRISAGSLREMRRLATAFTYEQAFRLDARYNSREVKPLIDLPDNERRLLIEQVLRSERRINIRNEVNHLLNQKGLESVVNQDCDKFLQRLAKYEADIRKFRDRITKDVQELDLPRQLTVLRTLQQVQFRARCLSSHLERVDHGLQNATRAACDRLVINVAV